ncbi:MAG: hypothetical protein P4M00_25005 [Azospirillaceae bacterium]|nr:hypothetical protein [Azospirillaceae bacterium]
MVGSLETQTVSTGWSDLPFAERLAIWMLRRVIRGDPPRCPNAALRPAHSIEKDLRRVATMFDHALTAMAAQGSRPLQLCCRDSLNVSADEELLLHCLALYQSALIVTDQSEASGAGAPLRALGSAPRGARSPSRPYQPAMSQDHGGLVLTQGGEGDVDDRLRDTVRERHARRSLASALELLAAVLASYGYWLNPSHADALQGSPP